MKILGFHTCEKTGGWSYIWENAPFLSGPTGPPDAKRWQWLTQGYYFWTDSDHFAHIWGRVGYKDEYSISRCDLDIPDDFFLDLAGNVSSQLYFNKLTDLYEKRLRKAGKSEVPTIATTIAHYRLKEENPVSRGMFPFWAIKAQDTFHSEQNDIAFTPKSKESTIVLTRQQVCLFEKAKKCIVDKVVVYPEEFSKRVEAVLNLRKVSSYDESTDGIIEIS
ncbi:hypothetical protein [Vibrio sp. 1180_3]|uniref:hypothetical protein n=1 Tax=Vibrio sp. 1180_3 TaxID=2528832 RepID=UPI0024058397|nr:hypothetical protein [Vibrio sp. 1180_3]MDF9401748.1 hypothetical protein [Vibrio sp. 1180_3]